LMFPTRKNVERLQAFTSIEGLLADAAARSIEPVRPRLLTPGHPGDPLLRGEPGYETATGWRRRASQAGRRPATGRRSRRGAEVRRRAAAARCRAALTVAGFYADGYKQRESSSWGNAQDPRKPRGRARRRAERSIV